MKILHVFTILSTAESFFDAHFRFLSDCGIEIFVTSDTVENPDFSIRNRIIYSRTNISRKISPLNDVSSILSIVRLIRQNEFDVVVGHTPKGAMVAMIAATMAGVRKRVYFRHGLIYTTSTGLKRFIFKTVEQFTSLLATRIVNVSPSLCDLAIKDHLNKSHKQLIIGAGTCGGIDTINIFNPQLIDHIKHSQIQKEYGIKDDDFIVGFCGRLCKDKGIIELIDGFKLFQQKNGGINVKLLLVGRYDERDHLPMDYILEIKNNPNIVSTGQLEQKELPYLYSLMDMFAFPSYREGFGMCVIEASAMEVPVLVSRSHGCIDAMVENKTGIYIDIDPGDISNKIDILYRDSDLRKKLGSDGRKWVCENFERTNLWPKHLAFYENL